MPFFWGDGWWHGCWAQDKIEKAFMEWHKLGSPDGGWFPLRCGNIEYMYDFKRMRQEAFVIADPSLRQRRSTRSVIRMIVTHEEDTARPYKFRRFNKAQPP